MVNINLSYTEKPRKFNITQLSLRVSSLLAVMRFELTDRMLCDDKINLVFPQNHTEGYHFPSCRTIRLTISSQVTSPHMVQTIEM